MRDRIRRSSTTKSIGSYNHLHPIRPVCYKKLKIKIPKSFISEGETAERTFDIGELNLAGSFSGESTDCLN
ncbi:unnamed protein product [Caenorhabditis nigoni]